MHHAASPMLAPILFLGFVFLVLVLILYRQWQNRKNWDRSLESLAGRLGLTFVPGTPWLPRVRALAFLGRSSTLTGDYKGHAARVDRIVRGTGRNKQTFSAIGVSTRNGSLEMYVSHNGFFARLSAPMTLFSKAKTVQTGDAELDKALLIRSNDAGLAGIILTTPEIRRTLLDTWMRHKVRGKLSATTGLLTYEERGTLSKPVQVERFAAMADLAVLLADAMDAAADVGGRNAG
jgi:hypothetical protein